MTLQNCEVTELWLMNEAGFEGDRKHTAYVSGKVEGGGGSPKDTCVKQGCLVRGEVQHNVHYALQTGFIVKIDNITGMCLCIAHK